MTKILANTLAGSFFIKLNDENVSFKGFQCFIDTETIGLYGNVRLLQVYCPEVSEDTVFIFDAKDYPVVLMKKRLKEMNSLVGHNLSYDFNCLNFKPDPHNFEDTFILDTIINFNIDGHGLDKVAQRVFGFDPYEGIDKKKMQKSDWTGVLTEEQYLYAAIDVWILPKIFEQYDIEKAGWTYKLDKASVITFATMGQKLPIDVEGLKAQTEINKDIIAEVNLPINVNSWQQVRPYIDHDESDDQALAELCAAGNQRACDVRKVRSLRKQNTFIKKFLDANDGHDYIKGYLNVGTRNGRSKCANQNLQQVPLTLKKYIKSKRYLIYSDYAQLELRSLCALIGEDVLERLFRNKEDLHSYVRDSLFDRDQHISDAGRGNSLRQIAKIYNFASLYGAGWHTIGNVLMKFTGMKLTEQELKRHKAKWLRTFPGIKRWHDINIRHWQAKRTLHTPMGRHYIGKLPTDTNNIQNSGFGAEVAKLALIRIVRRVEHPEDILMFVHDSITAEADTEEEAKKIGLIMAEEMSRSWFEVSKHVKISDLPMPINVFIKREGNWKDIDDSPDFELEYNIMEGKTSWM